MLLTRHVGLAGCHFSLTGSGLTGKGTKPEGGLKTTNFTRGGVEVRPHMSHSE